MSALSSTWHDETVDRLTTLVRADPAVRALVLGGSVARGDADGWSDLDLLVVVNEEALSRFLPGEAWLRPLGAIYTAVVRDQDALRAVTSVCFADMRRLDVVITTEAALERLADWRSSLLSRGFRVLFSRSARVEAALSRPVRVPPAPVLSDAEFTTMADQFWFRGVLAVTKVARDDLLIALHLSLRQIMDCAELGLMLRDREAGTTHHHEGGCGNRVAVDLDAARFPSNGMGILDSLEASAAAFDRLAAVWTVGYTERRGPLLASIERARSERRDRHF